MPGAFERLLFPYRQGMLNLAFRITQNAEDAQEVCQEALLKIFRYLDKYRSEMNLKNWIYQIVANAARDHLRKRKKQDLSADPQISGKGIHRVLPEDNLLQVEMRDKLQTCIRFLSPKERIVFVLRDVEGHSIRETADPAQVEFGKRAHSPVAGSSQAKRSASRRSILRAEEEKVMNCRKVKQWLPLYMGEELSSRKQQAMQEHLRSCSACQNNKLNIFMPWGRPADSCSGRNSIGMRAAWKQAVRGLLPRKKIQEKLLPWPFKPVASLCFDGCLCSRLDRTGGEARFCLHPKIPAE